jgi:integrase
LRAVTLSVLAQVLVETGLHRAQLVAFNVEHFDHTDRRLMVPLPPQSSEGSSSDGSSRAAEKPAGQTAEPVWLPLSVPCADLLGAYLDASGHGQQLPHTPLFRNLRHRFEPRGGRLKPDAVYKLVSQYGRQIKVTVSPRTLRRTAQERLWPGWT